MSIERDLHELLYCHDCVIVPHWGGFLTHYRPARLDEARKLVHPPGKDLSFNRNLTRNDGLLADHVARKRGISFDVAAESIGREVDDWRSALQHTGRLELPHIGIFYLDAEQNLQFDPDKRADHLKDAHGLRPVVAVPVERVREVPVVPIRPAPVEEAAPKGPVFPLLRVAAVLLGGSALWVGTRKEPVQWSSLSPFRTTERNYKPAVVEVPTVATAGFFALPEDGDGVRTFPLSEGDSVTVIVDLGGIALPVVPVDSTRVEVHNAPVSVPVTQGALRYHVVGGCFAQVENAERFLADLLAKGHQARALPRNGQLHPVAFGSYASRKEALEALEKVRDTESAQAWLLVR